MHSLSEENYLKTIYKLQETSNLVTTNAVANQLATKAASVTEMLGKLSKKKLIHYKKYQGVTLTDTGERIALEIIRKHRLWEMFLLKILNFKWDEVHDVAEQLEHIRSEKLISSIDKFLNYPKFDPHGDPIPDEKGNIRRKKTLQLSGLREGESGIFKGVSDHSDQFLRYLDLLGISLGNVIRIQEVNDYDKSLRIAVNNSRYLYLSSEGARNILVEKAPVKKP